MNSEIEVYRQVIEGLGVLGRFIAGLETNDDPMLVRDAASLNAVWHAALMFVEQNRPGVGE